MHTSVHLVSIHIPFNKTIEYSPLFTILIFPIPPLLFSFSGAMFY